MSFLKQYKLQRSVKTALSQLELDQMEVHLKGELLHLNSVAQQRKTSCENNIRTVMEDVSKVSKELLHLNLDAKQWKTNCENNIRTVMEDVSKVGQGLLDLRSVRYVRVTGLEVCQSYYT